MTMQVDAVCESCVMAVEDESMGLLEDGDYMFAAIELGYMLPDHTCEYLEGIACQCSGH